ncbi:hypothetical protein B0H67DRAFT_650030 [Lasiosphaeris hirsuta]|uniref:Uncharacterized protein n=1 Tax=Lasiosphaeris hirsuta TaxID=260670 RepID=A0AA39ZSF6_9PEZI|nr:hypothetical protein B0H67DRAFT_650030 [Lasiosphaeris hirsuta]
MASLSTNIPYALTNAYTGSGKFLAIPSGSSAPQMITASSVRLHLVDTGRFTGQYWRFDLWPADTSGGGRDEQCRAGGDRRGGDDDSHGGPVDGSGDQGGSGLSGGAIAGIAIGGVAASALLAVLSRSSCWALPGGTIAIGEPVSPPHIYHHGAHGGM